MRQCQHKDWGFWRPPEDYGAFHSKSSPCPSGNHIIGKFLSTKVRTTRMGCLMVKVRPTEMVVVPWILSASPANYQVKPGAKSISPYASASGFPVSLTRMHAKCFLFSRIRIFHLRSSWARFLGFTFLSPHLQLPWLGGISIMPVAESIPWQVISLFPLSYASLTIPIEPFPRSRLDPEAINIWFVLKYIWILELWKPSKRYCFVQIKPRLIKDQEITDRGQDWQQAIGLQSQTSRYKVNYRKIREIDNQRRKGILSWNTLDGEV